MKPNKIRVVRYKHSDTSRWVVEGLRIKGKRVRKFFQTKEHADTFAEQSRIQKENFGRKALEMPESLRLMATDCAERLKPLGRTVADATDFLIDYIKSCERSCSVAALVDEFIESKRTKGKSARYLADLDSRLGRFKESFGDKIAATIRTAEVDDWICGLGLSAQSMNNYRAVLSSKFSYAVKRGYAKLNPVANVERVKVVGDAPEILPPKGLAAVLNATATPPDRKADPPELDTRPLVPFFAIGAFAGLRVAELRRLDWREVDLAGGFIEVTAKKAKSARRRLVKIQPNLAAWLAPFAKPEGPVCPANFRKLFDAARRKAKLKAWPQNAMRHSFASYYLARFNDAARLALEMGHHDTSMIFAHYRELVKPAEAERYWNVFPEQADAGKIVSLAAASA